jgi:hypothetical protein
MWQVDELAEKYVHNSVYAFSENKVTNHVELDGLEAVEVKNGNRMLKSLEPKTSVPLKTENEPIIDGTLKITCCGLGGDINFLGLEMAIYRADEEISVIGIHENKLSFGGKEDGVDTERTILRAGAVGLGVNFEQERVKNGDKTNKISVFGPVIEVEGSKDKSGKKDSDIKVGVGAKISIGVGIEIGANLHVQRMLSGSSPSTNPRIAKSDNTTVIKPIISPKKR